MEALRAPPLREAVLAGRFLGAGGTATDLAKLVARDDAAHALLAWFGPDALQALRQSEDPAGLLRAALDRDIATLDAMIGEQLDAIYGHERFLRLEGSWRGLHGLAMRLPPTGRRIRLRLLSASWRELCRDLGRALEFDQSQLFHKIHDEEFGIAGGEPFGLIAADYEVRHRSSAQHPTDDVEALQHLAGVAAAAFAPVVLAAAPELVGLEHFADLTPTYDIVSALKGSEHQRWNRARSREDMRFLAVLLPRVLARPPWADDNSRVDRFRYRSVPGPAERRVWTSPVYGFAAVAIRAFERYSWPAELRGAEVSEQATGGLLEDLPWESLPSDPPGTAPARPPVEVALTDAQERELAEAGLVALAGLEGLPEACFGALPSLHMPPVMTTEIARANQRLSSQFNSILCASRFAHYVKLMGRDMIGSGLDAADVAQRLQQWLNRFCSDTTLLTSEGRASFPLQEARVEVIERPGHPGRFNCAIHLKPHHQLDDIGAGFRLVTQIQPQRAAA
jgi:type VI secretion system ImpC/EvpB family protein